MARRTTVCGAILLSSSLILGGVGGAAHHQARAAAGSSDTLINATTQEPDTLNPDNTQLVTGFDVDSAVFDTMMSPDLTGSLQPRLATAVEHSADGLTWTIHLRHGVKWADGQPFSSADVAYTYHALFDKSHNIFSTTGWDKIDKFSTPDDYTVVCHIKAVYAPFWVDIAYNTAILPKHIYSKPGFDFNKAPFNRTPFGTGPYMVTEWKTADHITLVPNPYSWRGQPHFKKIIYKIVPSSNTELVQLKTGDIDMGQIEESQVKQALSIAGKRLDVVNASQTWEHIDLKQWGFLREKAVRQALDYATPKQAILKSILGGYGTPDYTDLSPSFTYYYNPNVPTHPFSLAKASALLAADGFTKGSGGILQKGGMPFSMELWTISGSSVPERIATVLKNLWGSIGIDVSLHSQGVNTIFGANGPQFSHKMTGIFYSWTNSPPDPDDTFYWNSKQIPTTPTGSGGNDVGYFHQFDFQKQIDELTTAGTSTFDTAKRRQIYFQIQNLLADEVPVIFLYWAPSLTVVPNDLKGFQSNPFNSLFWNVVDWHRG